MDSGELSHRELAFDTGGVKIQLECYEVVRGVLLGKTGGGQEIDNTGLLLWPGKFLKLES